MNLLPCCTISPTTKPHHSPYSLIPHALLSTSSTTPTAPATSPQPTAVVIGAGLAGLAAATHLHSTNTPFLLLESSDAVGGRVRTDSHDGFLLDRGFQIFLTAYPEARRLLHYPSLHLQPFYPGALVYYNNSFHRVSDPFRRPIDGIASLSNPIGTLLDKVLVGLHRIRASTLADDVMLTSPETSISELLTSTGFSDSMIDRFFRPFIGGIFFDRDLSTTSRLYEFIIKCLALGDNTLPANGISAISNQLADRLPKESIRFNSRVVAVEFDGKASPRVRLESGEILSAELGLVVAVEQPEAMKLLPKSKILTEEVKNKVKVQRSTVCLYFAADKSPIEDPILLLNGSGKGIVNNMFFTSNVAPSYAPKGKVLVSVSLIGDYGEWSDEDLAAEVVRELSGWFGNEEVGMWRHLRSYRIGFAQPDQTPPTELMGKDPRVGGGVYVCGDHMSSATFDGALVSGRRAAEALVEDRARFLTV